MSFEQCFILFCNFPLLFAFVVGGLGFELCVFVAGWRHALRSEWPFIYYYYYYLIIIKGHSLDLLFIPDSFCEMPGTLPSAPPPGGRLWPRCPLSVASAHDSWAHGLEAVCIRRCRCRCRCHVGVVYTLLYSLLCMFARRLRPWIRHSPPLFTTMFYQMFYGSSYEGMMTRQ